MRLAVCALAVLACAGLLGGSAASAPSQSGAEWSIQPVSPTQKWLRVSVEGEPLYGFHVRGTDFTIMSVKRVLASGGPAPSCSLVAGTLDCDGELPGGISVFVNVGVSGTGGAYELAFLFQPGDTNLLFVPGNERPAPPLLGGTFGTTSATGARVTIYNPTTSSYREVEVAPVGFRITNVTHFSIGNKGSARDCGITEGGGVVCQGVLGPGARAVLTLRTTGFAAEPSAVLFARDTPTQVAFIVASPGNPCADIAAQLAGARAEATALRGEITKLRRGFSVPAAFAAQVKAMNARVGELSRRLAKVRSTVRGYQKQLRACGRATRKLAAAAACDSDETSYERILGKIAGLSQALRVERRIAASARPLVLELKKLGPRAGAGWRTALARLGGLISLPRRTADALDEAKSVANAVVGALIRCETFLTQG